MNTNEPERSHRLRKRVGISAVAVILGAAVLLYVGSRCGGQPAPLTGLRWTDETPSWSPDGRTIVFASNRANAKSGIDHLYLMKANGAGVKRLTWNELDAREPSFSPDGTRIAYVANRLDASRYYTSAGRIELISADGAESRVLTPGLRGDEDLPAWSPNGRWIAFFNDANPNDPTGGRDDLYIVRPDGSGLRRLAINIEGWALSWSPDGRVIAVGGVDGRLYRVPVGAARPVRVDVQRDLYITDIAWSPDGSTIAFVRGVILPGDSGVTPRYLYMLGLQTGRKRRLREVIDSDSVGDDEVSIVWLRRLQNPLLAVFDGNRTRLVSAAGHDESSLKTRNWGELSVGCASPDGQKLLFVDGPSGAYNSAIYVAGIDSRSVGQLTQRSRL